MVRRQKFNQGWGVSQIPALIPLSELVGVKKGIPPSKTRSNIPMATKQDFL